MLGSPAFTGAIRAAKNALATPDDRGEVGIPEQP